MSTSNKEKKKQNKAKSAKKAKFWGNVKFFFSSLLKNDTCVAASKKPWYAAIIIGILSTVIATTPIMVKYFSVSGGSIMDAPTYGLDDALVDFQLDLYKSGVSFQIDEKHELHVDLTSWNQSLKNLKDERQAKVNELYASYPEEERTIHKSSINRYDHWSIAEVTKSPLPPSTSESSSTPFDPTTLKTSLVETVDFTVQVVDPAVDFDTQVSTTLSSPDDQGNATYSVNTLFLGKDKFQLVKYNGQQGSSLVGYYDRTPAFNLKDMAKMSTHGEEYSVSPDALTAENIAAYKEQSIKAWRQLFTDGYDSTRISVGWTYTGIAFGVFLALHVFLGLMVFLMTRGKKNPFAVLKFWECQKIAYWAGFTPAVLSLIGLAWNQMAMIMFVFFYGMRIMWMSMRSLRPQAN